MRFEAIEIERSANYNFIVGTKDKPDEALKERIREQIKEAMEALGRGPDSYSVSILADDREEPEDKEYPVLSPGKSYLLFAFRSSGDSAESPSPTELEEEREEIARGIFRPDRSKVALVLLYDASLQTVITKGVPLAVLAMGKVGTRGAGAKRRTW